MWCGLDGWANWMWRKFRAIVGCEESYNLLWCSSIQHQPPPTPQDVCFLLVWGGEARTDGWMGWSDRTWRRFIYCDIVTRLLLRLSVRPTISLKPANYFLFRNLTFFVFFGVRICSFLSSGDCNNYGFIVGNFLVCNLSWTGSDMWKRLVFKDFNVEFCPSTRRFRPSSPPTFPPI